MKTETKPKPKTVKPSDAPPAPAPARNCDRFQTADEARDAVKAAFANTMLLDDRQLRAVCGWLFAPAEGGDHA